jgi:hypothetical protein
MKPTPFEQRAYAAAARHIDRGTKAHAEAIETATETARREIHKAEATIRRVSRRRAKREARDV